MTTRYGSGAKLFHWLVALLLLVQVPVGIAMIAPGLGQEAIDTLFIIHKGLGVVLLLVIVARVLWRLTHQAPPMSMAIPELERRIASVTHGFIYVLLVVVALSGYIRVVADGYPIELLDALGVPPLIPATPALAMVMSLLHRFAAVLLIALVAIHIAEVLRHHLVLRDGTLARMWPGSASEEPHAVPGAERGTGR